MVSTELQDQDLPQVFGRYLLLKRLSRGGMGEIFLARVGEIQGFEKPVIIKKVLPNLAADGEFIKRFIDEAQVAIKLNHANIASVFEVGKAEGDYFLAIEYVEGRDLRCLLSLLREERVRLPVELCLYIARELANGLGYAHRRTDADGRALKLVHCDISPPNVMISFDGEVKVIDFGIAKSAIRLAETNPNMGFGKFGYMAPEQLVKGGRIDRRTDIYAAGVVLFELLCGERMYVFPDMADYRQIARLVSKGEHHKPSQINPMLDESIDALVGRAIAVQQDDRYATAEEFRDAIQQKLYAMSPTISADSLAEFMHHAYAAEIEEERALVASTREVDVDQFHDQLSGSMTQTITFARAGQFGKRAVTPSSSPSVSNTEPLLASSLVKRHGLVAMAAIIAMLSGGVLTYLIAQRIMHNITVTPVLSAPPAPATVNAPPAPAMVPPPPVITPLPPHTMHRDGDNSSKTRRGAAKAAAKDDEQGGAATMTADAVTIKFREVKRKYDVFNREYGGRLDAQWTAIVNEITFGKAEKYEKINIMLDNLQQEMMKIRQEGG